MSPFVLEHVTLFVNKYSTEILESVFNSVFMRRKNTNYSYCLLTCHMCFKKVISELVPFDENFPYIGGKKGKKSAYENLVLFSSRRNLSRHFNSIHHVLCMDNTLYWDIGAIFQGKLREHGNIYFAKQTIKSVNKKTDDDDDDDDDSLISASCSSAITVGVAANKAVTDRINAVTTVVPHTIELYRNNNAYNQEVQEVEEEDAWCCTAPLTEEDVNESAAEAAFEAECCKDALRRLRPFKAMTPSPHQQESRGCDANSTDEKRKRAPFSLEREDASDHVSWYESPIKWSPFKKAKVNNTCVVALSWDNNDSSADSVSVPAVGPAREDTDLRVYLPDGFFPCVVDKNLKYTAFPSSNTSTTAHVPRYHSDVVCKLLETKESCEASYKKLESAFNDLRCDKKFPFHMSDNSDEADFITRVIPANLRYIRDSLTRMNAAGGYPNWLRVQTGKIHLFLTSLYFENNNNS